MLGVTDVPGEAGGAARRAAPDEIDAIGLRVGEAGYAAVAARISS